MKQLQKVLAKGAEGYTPVVMWFASGNLTKREMTYQLERFKAQGIKDFFIHPSAGLQDQYLGEHFFEVIRYVAKEAKRLGLHYWIYDEFDWPSGTAGGQISEKSVSHSYCFCRLKKKAGAGETVEISLPDKAYYHTQVLAFTVNGESRDFELQADKVVWHNVSAEEVQAEVYISRWQRTGGAPLANAEAPVMVKDGYLNTLSKEAVQVFLEKTHEAYKAHVGESFGEEIRGVFTDEVTVMEEFNETKVPRAELPWTPELPEEFRKRKGYDLIERLPDLVHHRDAKLAVDYWEVVSELFMEGYMDTTLEWCKSHHLTYTGHAFGEESMESTVYRTGDPYEFYKRFDWPGLDTICTYYRTGDMSFNIAAKKVSSAARFLQKERVLCETFTLGGWNMQLRDMKRIFNRLALLGVNCIQYMGARYEFKPARDCLGTIHNWQNPLFAHYEPLSKYVSAIQWFVANSTLEAETLLLYPLTAARAQMPDIPFPRRDDGDRNLTMYGLINSLLHLQIPFEIGYEQLIDEAEIVNGRLVIRDMSCHTVILPRTTYLKETTFRKLQEFAEAGGHIIAVNGKPKWIIGKEVYPAPSLQNAVVYDCYAYEKEGEWVNNNDYYQQSAPGAFTEKLRDALRDTTAGVVAMTPCEGIMSVVRSMAGNTYVMIINDKDGIQQVTGKVLSDKTYRAICTETGEEKAIQKQDRDFVISMEPYECVILEVSKACTEVVTEENCSIIYEFGLEESCQRQPEMEEALLLKNTRFIPAGNNRALPDVWQVQGEVAERMIYAHKAKNVKRICELAEKLDKSEMVLCRGLLNRYVPSKSNRDWFGWEPEDHARFYAGDTVVCAYEFTLDGMPKVLELIGEPQHQISWYLNGEEVFQSRARRVWHYANSVYDLTGIAKEGKNCLIGICTYPEAPEVYTLPCVVLEGDFRVFEDFVLTQKEGGNRLDYWNGQGYSCYTGDGIYEVRFQISGKPKVALEVDTKDVVEIFVNGNFVTRRLWEPYVADLTAYVTEGENRLEIKVTSTLSNFLYESNPSGIGGLKLRIE